METRTEGTMRALRAHAPNDQTQLAYESAPIPRPGPGDALVRVRACAITPNELAWPATWLNPDGSARPLPIVPGHEICGVVAALGPGADGLAVGQAVFGLIDFQRDGGAAEFVAARTAELAPKPAALDDIGAAAVPLAALTAWQALFDHAGLAAGQRVLIHGAAGGIGSFAVQLAHWRGAHVIATASAKHVDAVRALGADEALDYRTTPFDEALRDLDVVFDTVGGETWERSWRVLRPGGALVSIAVPRPPEATRVEDVRAVWFVVAANRDQLIEIGRLLDVGQVKPVVGQVLPIARGREAFDGGHGGRLGKTVLDLSDRSA